MPWIPCMPCAEAIIEAGIGALIGHEAMIARTRESWRAETLEAVRNLLQRGVSVSMYSGEVGGVNALMDRSVWQP